MSFWYLSHCLHTSAQASLRKFTDSPESSLLAYTKNGCTKTPMDFSMVVQSRLLRTCDKNQNHVLAQFAFIPHRDVWTCLGEIVLMASEITYVK